MLRGYIVQQCTQVFSTLFHESVPSGFTQHSCMHRLVYMVLVGLPKPGLRLDPLPVQLLDA